MTFNDNFVAVIKYKGKVLREQNGKVRLPFGSEYSIWLKNMESVNAVVTITVDGKDVLAGHSLIVSPNSDTELRGFMKGQKVTNRFRFIEKTDDIRNFRGDRIDDGLIRVEYKFEKKVEFPEWWYIPGPIKPHDDDPWRSIVPSRGPWRDSTLGNSPVDNTTNDVYYSNSSNKVSKSTLKRKSMSPTTTVSCHYANEDGITVKGSETRQDFVYGSTGTLEDRSHVITIQIKGAVHSASKKGTVRAKKVKKAVTVRTRLQCSSCGRKWKSTYKFCPRCSTYLD